MNWDIRILKVLEENTDSIHGMTKKEILQQLSLQYGDEPEEKAFARQIKILKESGYDIVQTGGRSTTYRLNIDRLSDVELLYIVTLVLGSDTLSKKEADLIVKKLINMPRHTMAKEFFNKYKNKFNNNNSAVNSLDKFNNIIIAIEENLKIVCKKICNNGSNEMEFVATIIQPIDFNIISNEIKIIAKENDKLVEFNLQDLIDVQLVKII